MLVQNDLKTNKAVRSMSDLMVSGISLKFDKQNTPTFLTLT